MKTLVSLSLLVALAASSACVAETRESERSTAAAATTGPSLYSIEIERIEPLVLPDLAPNEYHFVLAAATSANHQVYSTDDLWVGDGIGGTTLYGEDAPRLGRFMIGQIPVNDGDTLRIALLGDDNSQNTTLHWQDDGEKAPPAFGTAHAHYFQQTLGFVAAVGYTAPPFTLDTSISMLSNVQDDERTCSGPFLADSWDFGAADLLTMTAPANNFSYTIARTQSWSGSKFDDGDDPHGCPNPAPPKTMYVIRINRVPPSFGPVPTCTAADLVPEDVTTGSAWYGTWGDQPQIEKSRLTATLSPNPSHFGMITSSDETDINLMSTTHVTSSLVGALTYDVTMPNYIGDHWPPLLLWGPPPPPPPAPPSGAHEVTSSNNGVKLEKYVGRCAENGLPIQRMRYVRSSGSTIVTDVMLQPAVHVPY